MRLSQITLSGVVLLAASASAQRVQFDVRPGTARTGASPAPAVSQLPPAPVNGSDTCATADALGSVTGAIPYDNSAATEEPTIGQTSFTGGYCNYGCAEYGTGQVAVKTDVWFSWTSPATGRLRITTCPNQNDTKIGIYAGPACPTGTACLGCNDDYHFSGGTTAGLLDSILYYNVTIGEQLLFQVGQSSFNTTPGFVGTFNIDIDPPHETGVIPFDDNAAETNLNVGAVNDGALGINRYGNVGDVTTITGVQVCWGWAGSMGWTAGLPAYVGLWDDSVTNDGDPTDAVLIEQVATTIQSPGTDTYVTIPFASNHTVNGIYFLGYGSQKTAAVGGFNNFPLTADNSTCNIQPNTTWWVNNVAAPANLALLGSNTTPPHLLENPAGGFACQAQGAFSGILHSAIAIRANIILGPPPVGTGECFGDTPALCPCANGTLIPNPGAVGNGCANFNFPVGANLSATGVAVDNPSDSVILTCTGMPGPGLFFQANGLVGPLLNFNDGTLCAAAGIIRMGVVFPTAGVASYPGGLTPNPIHIAGAPVLTPTPTKHYQCWYRDITPGFCNPAGHNMSNGLAIVWAP